MKTAMKIFPGVCDGIFFDEAPSEIIDDSYAGYNDYVVNYDFGPDQPVRGFFFAFGSLVFDPVFLVTINVIDGRHIPPSCPLYVWQDV